jgi:hypothetical protein
MKKNPNLLHLMQTGFQVAKKTFKKKKIALPRIIPIPKIGNGLPLIPIFAGLSAVGALASGASDIYKNYKLMKKAGEELEEAKRHNRQMEKIVIGNGLYIKPYRNGYGLYLKPHLKN